MNAFLAILSRQGTLTTDQAEEAMHLMMRGKADPCEVAGLLMAIRARGETADELTGLAVAMRKHAVGVRCSDDHAIDVCGTGGDGLGTFNISTAVTFVCAGAGVTIAKHGNRSVSSRCGSADVLAALGVAIDLGPEQVQQCLETAGVAFMFAVRYHPAVRHIAPVRRILRVRTCFNVLGPMCNPARIRRQLVGAFSPRAAAAMATILGRLGAKHVIAVAARDGLDEISLCDATEAFEHVAGRPGIRRFTIRPEEYGFQRTRLEALQGGGAEDNAAIIRDVLDGKPGPARDVVLLNSAFGLSTSGRFADLDACFAAARESIDTGAARKSLERLVAASNA